MAPTDDLLIGFELHAPQAIREALALGVDPRARIDGRRPVDLLVEMYTRSTRFAECLRVLLAAGATLDNPLLEAVLLDDDVGLGRVLDADPANGMRPMELRCAFTSLRGATPLHVCAEYNSLRCARLLLARGTDVDARAGTDGHGIGGHTPLFHTVNSPHNHCRETMELLVEAGADIDVRLRGLLWGGGFDWETTVFDVTPLSYAQCGLYAQFHRREEDVYANVTYLYRKRYGVDPPVGNVPNRYLQDDRLFPPRT